MANRVIHFEVQADDVSRAKDFYEKVLGWEIKQAMKKEEGGMDYWMVVTGETGTPGINGGLYQRPADKKFYLYDCTIEVEDIDKVISDVKANGGKIETYKGQEKWEMTGLGWFSRCTDTEGNRFGLMQPTGWKPK